VSEKVTIKIPKPLYKNLKKIIKNTGFSSVTEFIVYVIRDVVSGKMSRKNNLTEKEVKMIVKKLKTLGYI
jgi:metal-responsive CopG/Arc/MetJ family transcriptional regulator